jgi:hypothetical protein
MLKRKEKEFKGEKERDTRMCYLEAEIPEYSCLTPKISGPFW